MACRRNRWMLLGSAGWVVTSTSAAAPSAAPSAADTPVSSAYADAIDFVGTLGAGMSLGFLGCVVVGFIVMAVLTLLIDRREKRVQALLSKFMLGAPRRGRQGEGVE